MPVGLMFASGSFIDVPPTGVVTLGRQHAGATSVALAQVSRRQCDVVRSSSKQQGDLTVTSKSSSNPTGIQFKHSKADKSDNVFLLKQGESAQLGVGDRVLLLATQVDQYLEVADIAQPSSSSISQGPASKRQKLCCSRDPAATHSQSPSLSAATDNDAAFPDSKSPAAAEAVIQSPASQYTVGDESAANEAAADILAADAPHDPQQSTPGDQSAAVSDNLTADAIAERVSPVMLILCGVPGSGKSTFSAQLIAKGHTSWVRVNQDSINKGRRGSKQQCLAAVKRAVLAGCSCVIDRCHQDAQQRSAFIKLAADLNCQAHAVVLGLPVKVCASRAAARVGHEGGVQGPTAPQVVQMMHSQFVRAGPPTKGEGLTSLMDCHSDADVKSALQAWCAYGEGGKQPAQLFQRANPLCQAFASGTIKLTEDMSGVKPAAEVQTCEDEKPPLGQQQPPLQQQPLQQRQSLSASQKQVIQPTGSSSISTTSEAHSLLPAKRSHPDSQKDAPSNSTAHCPGTAVKQAPAPKGSSQNAFALLMQASKGSAKGQPKAETSSGKGTALGRHGSKQSDAGAASRAQGSWQEMLQRIAATPERYQDQYPEMQVYHDCVVINDAYPKAHCHGLVIARTAGLDGPADLTAEHLPLLQAMQTAGEAYARRMQGLQTADASVRPGPFKMGFHSIPSMKQLHMHVISQDFDSAALKHKKHWNSFTTSFFIDISDALAQLQANGSLQLDTGKAENMLKQDLQCHICGKPMKNMPLLKSHIHICKHGL